MINVGVVSGANPGYPGAGILGQADDKWNNYNSGTAPLLDYSGNPTTVTMGSSGAGSWDDTTGGSPVTNYFNLMRSYLNVNSGTFTITLSGWDTNAAYEFVTYDAGDQPAQGATLGGALSGTTTGNFRDPLSLGDNYLVNTNIISDDSGRIVFTVSTPSGQTWAALNGLQVAREDISTLRPIPRWNHGMV